MALIHSVTTSDSNTYGLRATAIPFGVTDSTSTSTVVTATVTGVTELVDGEIMFLTNGTVTTAAGWTLNVNGLGAKPVYSTMAEESRITTTFNSAYTMLFIYNSSRVDGGCWDMYYGYDSNTNTIGYQLRNNSCNMTAVQTGYRYRLWLTDADGQGWVPINTSTATNATTARSLNTRPIDPFGRIVYCSHNATKSAGAGLGTSYQWDQYTLAIGYSYVMTLTAQAPVYLRCTPQADGSAVMQDIVQTLPTTNDGYIYIFLGTSYSTTSMELLPVHPVYYHDGTGIRLWTGSASSGATAMTDAEVNTAVDDAFVYNITLNAGASIASVQNLQGQTVTTGIAGGTYKVVVDTDSDGWYASSTPQVTFQLDSVSKTASFVMPDEAISIDVFVPHGGGTND